MNERDAQFSAATIARCAIKSVTPLSLGAPWNVDEVYNSNLNNVQCPSNSGDIRHTDPTFGGRTAPLNSYVFSLADVARRFVH